MKKLKIKKINKLLKKRCRTILLNNFISDNNNKSISLNCYTFK